MSSYENLTTNQKLRASLHRDVRSISSETCHWLGLEITKPAMEIIAELVYRKISVMASDLEAFAKHARRSTVNNEDVKLLVRRNPALRAHLNNILPPPQACKENKRRKTIPANAAKQPKTPRTKTSEPTLPPVEREDTSTEINRIDDDAILNGTIDLTFD